MKKTLFIFIFCLVLFPLFANASWWNPIDWFSFLFRKPVVVEKTIDISTSTTPINVQTTDSFPSTTPKLDEAKPVIKNTTDNSAAIQAEVQKQVQAALKAKADQDALVAKQKADEQTKVNTAKALSDQIAAQQAEANRIQALNAQNVANIAAQNAANLAAQQAAQQKATQDAANQALIQAQNQKNLQLNAINQQIAVLNAKYAKDVSDARSAVGVTLEQSDAVVRTLNNQYTIDYDALQAQWQQVKYSN